MSRTILAVCLMAPWLASCATGGAGTDAWCATHAAIYLTDPEIAALSPETRRHILADNETGARLCGWRPTG